MNIYDAGQCINLVTQENAFFELFLNLFIYGATMINHYYMSAHNNYDV